MLARLTLLAVILAVALLPAQPNSLANTPPQSIYLPLTYGDQPPPLLRLTLKHPYQVSQRRDQIQTITAILAVKACGPDIRAADVILYWHQPPDGPVGAYTTNTYSMPPLDQDCRSSIAIDVTQQPANEARPVVVVAQVTAPHVFYSSNWPQFYVVP